MRPRSPSAHLASVRTAAAALVLLGYGLGMSASSAWQGLALGAHVATAHQAGDGPRSAASPEAAQASSTRPDEAAHTPDEPSSRSHDDAHDHGDAHSHGANSISSGMSPLSEETPAEGSVGSVTEVDHAHEAPHSHGHHEPSAHRVPVSPSTDAVHTHDGVAHRHTPTESEHGAPPPPELDKHRLPTALALWVPTASRGAAAGVSREAAGTEYESVETQPPLARA